MKLYPFQLISSLSLPGFGPVTEGHSFQAYKKRVFAYFDGSNFYHGCKIAFGTANINFKRMAELMLISGSEKLVQVQYHTAPLNRQEDPVGYRRQQQFLTFVRKTPLVEVRLGRLVKRPLRKIHIECPVCGHKEAEELKCPGCAHILPIRRFHKLTEKGVDVRLAMSMLLDALDSLYDAALLFSNDADYSPAIKYIVNTLHKDVIYCRFPGRATSELLQVCSANRIITGGAVDAARPR